MKRIAILTSGGDAPGMNAAIRAAARTAIQAGTEVLGVRRGYLGLIENDFVPLSARSVGGIIERGGTVLETMRCPAFETAEVRAEALKHLVSHGVEGLIVIGGDGSQHGACALHEQGFPVNGVASTIDNDLYGSEMTIGVDTALNVALEAIDRLRTTASSHHRLFIVEVMGRNCGYLALCAGLAGGAEVIVTPEFDMSPEAVVEKIHEARYRGKRHAVVVLCEGAKTDGRALYEHLLANCSDYFEPRLTVLGHVQRGGKPGAFDRLLATRLASKAVRWMLGGRTGVLSGLQDGEARPTALTEVTTRVKPLPPELLELAATMQL